MTGKMVAERVPYQTRGKKGHKKHVPVNYLSDKQKLKKGHGGDDTTVRRT